MAMLESGSPDQATTIAQEIGVSVAYEATLPFIGLERGNTMRKRQDSAKGR
jgi:hypothetical protein